MTTRNPTPRSDDTTDQNSLHPRAAALMVVLLLAGGSVLLRALSGPQQIEQWYSRRTFPVLREGFDATMGRLPFPLFYLFWVVMLWLLLRLIVNVISSKRKGYRKRVILKFTGLRVGQVIGWLLVIFLWAWGFNYGRVAVEEQIGFAVYQPSLEELREKVYREAAVLGKLRAEISNDTLALRAHHLPNDLETSVRPLVATALLRHGYPAPGKPRGWKLLPKGILLRLSTAGVYWPWAGQGNIDAGLHPLQQPAVLAHELAHAYGFGDEGTCSFWAQLAAFETDDPALQYTIRLAYWRQLAGQLRYIDPEGYLAWRQERMPPGVRNDLQAIYDNGALYADIAPVLRDATYTAYLHAQGIEEGLLNYGRVVQLVEGYERNYSSR